MVRNGRATLPALFDSVRPYVDEIGVYDTGSIDGTLELLAEHAQLPGAPLRFEAGEWREDFAWARERSFALASEDADWYLWLDADDELLGGERLRALVEEAPDTVDGFFLYYDYAREDSGRTTLSQWRVRIARRASGFRWTGAAHEDLVLPDGSPGNFEVVPAEQLRVVHRRHAIGDAHRNLRILRREFEHEEAAGGAGPRTLYDYGREAHFWGEFEEAVEPLRRFLDGDDTLHPDIRSNAAHLLAMCLRVRGAADEAIEVELAAERERPGWTESALGLAESYASREDWEEAERWARIAIERGVPNSPFPLEPARLRMSPRVLLARALLAQGAAEEALDALANEADVRTRLEALLEVDDTVGAVSLLEEALGHHDPVRAGAVRALVAATRRPA